MADNTHKLQKDPPEGSREVVEHELKHQSGKSGQDKANAAQRDHSSDKPDQRSGNKGQ